MDTDAFRYMIALAECKSISEAARKLYITQPALTKHLNKLEENLGIGGKLFDRSVTPIKITPAGEIFLEYSRRYIALENEMKERLDEAFHLQKGNVKVASTSRGGWHLGQYMGLFLEQYKDIKLELQDASAQKCEQMIERDEIDIAVYTDPVCSHKIEYVPLIKDKLVIAVPKDYFLLKDKNITGNSLSNPLELEVEELRDPRIRFVLSTKDHSMHLTEQAFFEKNGINPISPMRVDFINTRYSIACGGAGIIMIPLTTANRIEAINSPVFCTVKGRRLVRQVIIAKKKGKSLSVAGEIFWNFIIQQSFGTSSYE